MTLDISPSLLDLYFTPMTLSRSIHVTANSITLFPLMAE